MAYGALIQSGLKKEGYEPHQVARRKELPNGGGIEFVEARYDSPIQHGAHYTVSAVLKERMN